MTKCDVTTIKICELVGFVEIIQAIKTKSVSLSNISILVQIVCERYYHSCSNDPIQILLKNGLVLGTKPNVCMGSSEHNHDIMSSLIGGKMLNFGMEAVFIFFFLNITTKLVISQIKILWHHHFGILLPYFHIIYILDVWSLIIIFNWGVTFVST